MGERHSTRKQRVIHRRPGRQLVRQSRKFRRCLPAPRRMPDVIAQEAHREHPAPLRAVNAARGVQRQHVEAHRIARLELPAENGKVVARAPRYRADRQGCLPETTWPGRP